MICSSCGSFNPDGSTFCQGCGAKLSNPSAASVARQTPSQAYNQAPAPLQQNTQTPPAGNKFTDVKKSDGIACGILGLLLFILGLAGYMINFRSDPNSSVLTVCLLISGLGSLFLMLGEILTCLATAKFNRLNRGIAPAKSFSSTIASGVLLMLFGIGGIAFSVFMNNNSDIVVWSVFNLGERNPGNGFMGLGGLIIIEGIIIMIVGLVEQSKSSNNNVAPPRM